MSTRIPMNTIIPGITPIRIPYTRTPWGTAMMIHMTTIMTTITRMTMTTIIRMIMTTIMTTIIPTATITARGYGAG